MDRKYSNQTGTRKKISLGTRAKNLADRAGTLYGSMFMAGMGADDFNERMARGKKRRVKRIEDDQQRRKGPSVSLPIPPRSR
jgi:hypothetical protein